MNESESGGQGNSIRTVVGPAPVRMGRGDLAVLVVVACALVAFLTWPDQPALQHYTFEQPRNSRFSPGEGCPPPTADGRSARGLSEKCRVAWEAYRQGSDDLIQQTRAADAAQAQARLAYSASWAALVQAVGGILTLIAASFAAYYAREAAFETRRGAKAARKQLKLARELGELELRSYISFSSAEAKLYNKTLSFKFKLDNGGAIIAKNISVKIYMRAFYKGKREVIPEAYFSKIPSVMARGSYQHAAIHFNESTHPGLKSFLDEGMAFISMVVKVEYTDYFGSPRRTPRSFGIQLSKLTKQYAEVREQHIVGSENPKSVAKPPLPKTNPSHSSV